MLAVFSVWKESRLRAERAGRYVARLMADPEPESVAALAAAGDGDDDHARWELRYARRAIGLLVSERDALDDRTSSEVAAALERALLADPNVAPDRRDMAGRQMNERLSAYRATLADRGGGVGTSARLARTLLLFAGSRASPETAPVVTELVGALVAECNRALRDAYVEANLPNDVAPSAVRAKRPETRD